MTRKHTSDKPMKHRQRMSFDDVILAPKHPTRRLPSRWEEDVDGELQPIFSPKPPERLYARDDLIPYKSFHRLFQDKTFVLEPLSIFRSIFSNSAILATTDKSALPIPALAR